MSVRDGDWLDRIGETLATLGLFDDATREAIVREVREAIDDGSADPPDNVTVLPNARRVHDDLDDPFDDDPFDDDLPRFRVYGAGPGEDDPEVAVDLLRALEPRGPRRSLEDGSIRLAGDPDVWQTLLHGRAHAAYRVHCDEGELHVAVDGELVARLEHGQSSDVEGAVIRVRACGERVAEGRFRRLG